MTIRFVEKGWNREFTEALSADARVRGVRNLHAKLSLFGASRAIITPTNLPKSTTSGSLDPMEDVSAHVST